MGLDLLKMSDGLKSLIEYEKQNYVFHGSPDSTVKEFEPRENIHFDDENDFNNDTAVFLANDPAISIVFSIINSHDSRWPENAEWSLAARDQEPSSKVYFKIPKVLKDIFNRSIGYVYVFKKEDYMESEGSSWQLKSKKHLTPIDKIEVTFEDLEFFSDRITWI